MSQELQLAQKCWRSLIIHMLPYILSMSLAAWVLVLNALHEQIKMSRLALKAAMPSKITLSAQCIKDINKICKVFGPSADLLG